MENEDPGIGVYAHVKAIEMLLVDTLALVIAASSTDTAWFRDALLLGAAGTDLPTDESHPLYQVAVRAQQKHRMLVLRAVRRAEEIRGAR